MEKDTNEPVEIISSYGDQEAVEDGMLVRVNETDRVTRTVYDWISKRMEKQDSPPMNWPVSLMNFIISKQGNMRAAAMIDGLIGVYGKRALQIYEHNLGGGIWVGAITFTDTEIKSFEDEVQDTTDTPTCCRVWLMPNELGGLTLMFPEDY